ncbi:TetR family transcriptional regulator C-terminal domain-containing protein [Georgenia sp. TF02-10]|nr:TetR family transcriptional regulator C-terminal domain-containing protein [Georgenia sp. TF02-10]
MSRPTFYAQFSGLDELTVVMLSESLQEMHGVQPRASVRATIGELVTHIDARRSFYRASLDWPVSGRAHEAVVDALAEQLLPAIARSPESDERNVQDLAHFLAGGTISALTSWLRQAQPLSPEVVAERLSALLPLWGLDDVEQEHGSNAARR